MSQTVTTAEEPLPDDEKLHPTFKAVILLSGGMDSATLLYEFKSEGYECQTLGIDYGQRHAKELGAASLIADAAGVPFQVISLAGVHSGILRHANSSQTNKDVPVPHGHYASANMKKTVVPNRNMMMLSVACCLAIKEGASVVGYAAHAGDHAIYPDCRPEFITAMKNAFQECDWHPVRLRTPFAKIYKHDIALIGHALNVPFDLTWSCYDNKHPIHCGECGTCVERKEAFRYANLIDPTEYVVETGAKR
jgi:7-cyano-7-deazaguanine synthase